MTRAPNVVFVNHSAEPGGGELALLDLATHTRHGRVILLADGPFAAMLDRAGVEHRLVEAGAVLDIRRNDGIGAILGKSLSLAGLVGRLARAVRGADLIYANSQKAFIASALAAAIVRKPLVWHLHDIMDAAHFSGPVRKAAIALGNRFARHVIANSDATAAAFRAAGGTSPVTVVHNGIDPRPFDPTARSSLHVALATEIGSGDAPLLGLFGRLAPWKGQQVAIEALEQVADAHLVLVGDALFGETAHEAALRALVKAKGLGNRIHFLGFREDVAALMGGVDVALHCSIAPEPFGRVIVEAMMAQTPAIATAAGGALEIVGDGRDGLLTPPGDPVALAAAIRSLLSDRPRAADIALAGRTMALARFSLDGSIARLHAVISATAR